MFLKTYYTFKDVGQRSGFDRSVKKPSVVTNEFLKNLQTKKGGNMALSDKKIEEEIKKGNIIVSPFNKANLNTSSYDVCLGEYYFREQEPKPDHPYFNIWSKKDTKRVWGERQVAEKASVLNIPNEFFEEEEGIRPDDRIILIRPQEIILAHTEEFIGGKNTITTMMKARSSFGRCFIEVCKCAGWGDVGYINRWTMEITNCSRHYTIPLVVGRRISQIVFFETGEILEEDYSKSGKYQASSDIKQLKKGWKPETMLPRLYQDRDIKK